MMRLWGFEMIMLGGRGCCGRKLREHGRSDNGLGNARADTHCETTVALSPAVVQVVSSPSDQRSPGQSSVIRVLSRASNLIRSSVSLQHSSEPSQQVVWTILSTHIGLKGRRGLEICLEVRAGALRWVSRAVGFSPRMGAH